VHNEIHILFWDLFLLISPPMSLDLCFITGWSFMNEMNEKHRANSDQKVSL